MCAYSRDWDETVPIDHTKFSAQPGHVRSAIIDVAERLENMFNGFISGETQTNEGVKNLPYVVQASDPGATANKIKLYAKDVSSKAELFAQDEDGDVIQITDGGVLKAIKTIYPVGSLYITTVSTNPATVLGFGTWAAFGEGKVLVGLDSGDTDFDTSEETGGAKTHSHSSGSLAGPSHNHTVSHDSWGEVIDNTAGRLNTHSDGAHRKATGAKTSSSSGTGSVTGSTATASSLQPYVVVYMFKRTA